MAALEILLGCGYVRAIGLASLGAVARAGVGWVSTLVRDLSCARWIFVGVCWHMLIKVMAVYPTSRRCGWGSSCRWRGRDRRLDRGVETSDGESGIGMMIEDGNELSMS